MQLFVLHLRKRIASQRRRAVHTRTLTVFLLIIICSCGVARGDLLNSPPERYAEESVKAAFLFNFIKFVDWPADRFPPEGRPIRVGILGRDPFAALLDPLEQRTVRSRTLELIRNPNPHELATCQVVFISSSEEYRLPSILADLARHGVLTVGDMPDFAERGGVIGFVRRDNRVGLDVNLHAARTAQLSISAKLLELAKVIGSPSYRDSR